MGWQVIVGDSARVLRAFPDASYDALVTDPPAGIGFMGKEWDKDRGGRDKWVAWLQAIMVEAWRVLKPGAHGLVWALPRTSHWTATALENAGFEIRDVVTHHFGTGFPKSLNIGDGRGTALKPATENWILIRKPLDGTVARNVAMHGTGGLNIDTARITAGDGYSTNAVTQGINTAQTSYAPAAVRRTFAPAKLGRWPANLLLSHGDDCTDTCGDGCPVGELDRQSGQSSSSSSRHNNAREPSVAKGREYAHTAFGFDDAGGASRFFYCPKPPRSERDLGLTGDLFTGGAATDRKDGSAGLQSPRAGAGRNGGVRNHHPTVKAIGLMRYLCRLITPPGGRILDPFAGTGRTGIAAIQEGMHCTMVELSADYAGIASAALHSQLA